MKGDFSRDTFDRAKHFSRVLMQQGRVQLDADWNEQAAIVLHYLRTLAADLIGPFAGPAGEYQGFEIAFEDGKGNDFKIGQGRYYVDGILCENYPVGITYQSQPDFPNPDTRLVSNNPNKYLVYLDVWEHHITVTEDPHIREKALGGPDTASRTKVVWQVKLDNGKEIVKLGLGDLSSLHSRDEIIQNWKHWINRWQPQHLGCLRARVKKPESSSDPCLTAPDAKYRGTENHLYRVEIHKGGSAGEATFKWSRDNGAIVTECDSVDGNANELTVRSTLGFTANQWVELTNSEQELRGHPGVLVKISAIEAHALTFEPSASKPADCAADEKWPTKVRRWDQYEKQGIKLAVDHAVWIEEGKDESNWIDLEDGIQIQFQLGSNRYRTGDYWLIPARVATKDIEWPRESPTGPPHPQPPHGVRHHYAPLAILKYENGKWGETDCRCQFTTLNDCKIPSPGEEGMGESPSCSSSNGGRSHRDASKRVPPQQKKPRVK